MTTNNTTANSIQHNPIQNWCRIAGILYTIIIFCGIYAEVGIRERFINFSSASETADNVETHALQFRSAVIFELIMCCSDVGVAIILGAILLYQATLKAGTTANASSSVLMIALSCIFRLMQTSIIASNLLHMFAASLILDPSLSAVTVAGSDLKDMCTLDCEDQGRSSVALAEALALLFLSIQKYGYTLALVFFGVSLFFLGTIIVVDHNVNNKLFPHYLGWACILAGFGYVLDALMYFLWDGYNGEVSSYFMLPVLVADSFGWRVGYC